MRLRPAAIAATTAALLAAGACVVAPVQAQGRGQRQGQREPPPAPPESPQGRQEPRRNDRDPLAEAVRRAERNSRGEVLSAERVPYDGRDVNRIKVVDGRGRVRVYMDDPRQQEAPRQDRRPQSRGDDD